VTVGEAVARTDAGMILEGLVTTTDAAGRIHVAAMGPEIADAERMAGRISRLSLRPFGTSQTAGHLVARRAGVFHVTDDVLLLARLVVGVPVSPPARPATAVPGWVLADACHAWEFVVDAVDTSRERLCLEARVVATHAGRPFFGFNRAAHAVVEGAILVTRLHLLGADEVRRRLTELQSLVQKTGGDAEHEAFGLLLERVDAG
jgi:hypothetical protein